MSHGYVFVLLYYIGCDNPYNARCVYTYRREAFALLVSIDRAMRRPLTVKRATSVGFTLFLYINLSLGASDKKEKYNYMFGFQKPRYRDSFKVDIMGNIQRRQSRLGRTMNLQELKEECIMYACDMCIEFYKQSDGLLTPDWITHIAKETIAVFREEFVEFDTTQHFYCAGKILEYMRDISSTEMEVNRYYNRI